MSWIASDRFGARPAPDGLALVQDLVNTHAVARDGMDLLSDPSSAEHWIRAASNQWARARKLTPPMFSIDQADTQTLRELRAIIAGMLDTPPDKRGHARANRALVQRTLTQLASDNDGALALVPVGSGTDWVASAVWSEIFLAQHAGHWIRMKLCREPGCRSAFYDASRNGSGVWHTCTPAATSPTFEHPEHAGNEQESTTTWAEHLGNFGTRSSSDPGDDGRAAPPQSCPAKVDGRVHGSPDPLGSATSSRCRTQHQYLGATGRQQ